MNALLSRARRAFSLIELLVVVGIFAFISIIILANHGKFNSNVLLDSLGYNAALSVRQAQVYGISVRASADLPGQFQIGYGVHLQKSTPLQYILFADLNKNQKYDGTPTDSIVETYAIGQGHSIKSFCAYTTSASNCSDDAASPITFLDISFLRPNPDAIFTTDKTGVTYSRAAFTLQSGDGRTRTVSVATTGEVSVTGADATACTPSNICYNGNLVNSCSGATITNCQGYGCANGSCLACVPNGTLSCVGANVVNSCGATVQACGAGTTCTNGACVCVPNGTLSCSGNNVVNSCGTTVQACTVNQTCTSGACVNNACVPNGTYTCNDGFNYYDSCGTFKKTCANGCTGTYPGCIAGGGGGGCFSPETLILMADGSMKPIINVAVGDEVIGADAGGARGANKVTKVFIHEGGYQTLIVNGSLTVTPIHPIMTERGWVDAGDLVVGDVMTGLTGKVPITSIDAGPTLPAVYNLEVEPDHTYFAGGVLVHNKIQQ